MNDEELKLARLYAKRVGIQPYSDAELPALDAPFTCRVCGFEGTSIDIIETPFKESDGRHFRAGTRLTCKHCGAVVLEIVKGIS